jgi:hypothetical protein
MKKRTTIIIKFEADLDMVPGTWHKAEDWVDYVKNVLKATIYNSKVTILDTTTHTTLTNGTK